jgi:hypothetical protein
MGDGEKINTKRWRVGVLPSIFGIGMIGGTFIKNRWVGVKINKKRLGVGVKIKIKIWGMGVKQKLRVVGVRKAVPPTPPPYRFFWE